jgi:hypothetical protein
LAIIAPYLVTRRIGSGISEHERCQAITRRMERWEETKYRDSLAEGNDESNGLLT